MYHNIKLQMNLLWQAKKGLTANFKAAGFWELIEITNIELNARLNL